MTEQTTQGETRPLSKDELLDIAAQKLRERQVNVVRRLEPQVTTYKEVPRVSQLIGAHYEKLRAGLEEGSKTRAVVNGLERLVYDGAKVADFAVQAADIVVGGLLVGHGLRGVATGVDRWRLFGGKLDFTTGRDVGMMMTGKDAGTVVGRTGVRLDRLGGAGKLLTGFGVLRYAPITMVARTALNMTL